MLGLTLLLHKCVWTRSEWGSEVSGRPRLDPVIGPHHLQPLATLWRGPLTRDRRLQVKYITATLCPQPVSTKLNKNNLGVAGLAGRIGWN